MTIRDSIRSSQIEKVQEKLARYQAHAQQKASEQKIGMLAPEAYKIARLIVPDAADSTVNDGNQIQAAVILLIQQLLTENEQQQQQIKTLNERLTTLNANLTALETRVMAIETSVLNSK